MALTEETQLSHTILPMAHVEVREERLILDDGEVIARTFARHVVDPDDDYSDEPAETQDIVVVARSATRLERWEHRPTDPDEEP